MSISIALVNPPPQRIREKHDAPGFPHLGLGYIAALLKSQNVDCTVIDAKLEMIDLKGVERRLWHQKPDIVGITAMTHEIPQASKVGQIAKTISPTPVTVLGGPHATALPRQSLEEFPCFDVVLFGEGEITFFELVTAVKDNQSLEEIKGLGYRGSKGIHINETRRPLENLDQLPFPAWELFPPSNRYPIITSRGCPFRCNFCMRVLGSKVRKRTPKNVIAELQRDVNVFHARVIDFADETFAIDKRSINELLDLMIENGLHDKIKWNAETRVDLADYELFKKMKVAGCNFLGFGIESGNEQILKASKKGITLDSAMNAIALAKKARLRTGSFFIIGHPFETRKTVQDTINFAAKLNTTRVAFGIMVPYPGTEIYNMAKKGEGGYKMISTDWSDFNKTIGDSLELEQLSRKELEMLQLLAYLKFYLSNYRFMELAKQFVKQRRTVFSILGKLLQVKEKSIL